MAKFVLASLTLLSLILIVSAGLSQVASAQSVPNPLPTEDMYAADLALARQYVPVFYFHPDEIYLPQPVDVVMGLARIRQSKHLWFDTTLLNNFTARDLFTISSDSTFFLDQWFGDSGSSEYANYSSHRAIYQTRLGPDAGGPASLTYAHVVHNQNPEYTAIQYWLFYFYNDWFNKHEGDWELVEVILLSDEQPAWVVYSQHHGGVRRSWTTTSLEDGTHPVVYVARGSHANYFAANEVFPFEQDIGNRQLVLVDRTGISKRLIPQVSLIPSRAELIADPAGWPGVEWLMFRGRWGETAVYGDFNGPYGPADKGFQWEDPYSWGVGQPLDRETWYKNRLRVELTGSSQSQAQIYLVDAAGQKLPQSETTGDLAILHTDPVDKVWARIDGAPDTQWMVTVYWPDRASKTVTRTAYSGLVLDTSGHAKLEISADQVLNLTTPGQSALSPRVLDTYTAIWDAPDTVIVGDALPFHEILGGLFLSLLISLVPVLILIAILYWVDQYHKGPVRLLVVAFSWGAIPALLVAFSTQLFLRIPPNLMGSSALEVIRLGFLAPILEEILKAAGVVFIFWRFRREIDDLLDGMIYGAVVGFGFAFISNLFRYAGDFFSVGYPALNLSFVAVRTVHVLNHGLYTAIFGAFLGYAAKEKNHSRFYTFILVGLVLSIATHAMQNLLSNSLVGLNVFTVIVTIAGTLVLWVVAGWSLLQQKRLLRTELQGLVHESLYASIQDPLMRIRAQWHSLRRDGLHTYLELRRLQGLCIKLAHARLHARLHPEDSTRSDETAELQAEIARIFNTLNPIDL
ncbi:MAG TPA: PrsW family glutamic-type intramembrane protease [Anaerolineales bacterium]|nr:PrsW family glutamic-type intramembrane protease [Anaerolineales bacterium]